MKKSKKYVLDTNIFILDPNAIDNFVDNEVIISSTVISELNELKEDSRKTVGVRISAQEANKILESYLDKYTTSLKDHTIKTDKNVKISFVSKIKNTDVFDIFTDNKNDNYILQLAKDMDAILVTNDVNLRLKAKILSVKAESYKTIEVDTSDLDFIHHINEKTYELIGMSVTGDYNVYKIMDDEVIFKKNHYYLFDKHIYKCKNDNELSEIFFKDYELNKRNHIKKIKPKNNEQVIAIDALKDDNIKVVTLDGPAGTGKTLLSLATAFDLILDDDWMIKDGCIYDGITIIKSPIHLLGKDRTGFLPGDEIDKISVFLKGIISSLSYLVRDDKKELAKFAETIDKNINYKTDEGILKLFLYNNIIKVINSDTIKGMTLHNQFVIIEESEDLSFKEIKMIMTRIGENCKVVCIGDNDQISAPYQDSKNSGLSIVSYTYKNSGFCSNIYLNQVERSIVAEWATKMGKL